jgi:hypothetical protein
MKKKKKKKKYKVYTLNYYVMIISVKEPSLHTVRDPFLCNYATARRRLRVERTL